MKRGGSLLFELVSDFLSEFGRSFGDSEFDSEVVLDVLLNEGLRLSIFLGPSLKVRMARRTNRFEFTIWSTSTTSEGFECSKKLKAFTRLLHGT